MTGSTTWILDDRLLIDHLLKGVTMQAANFATTSLWWFRACRAAVAGAGGQLSGPFERISAPQRRAAIRRLLELPDDVQLPDPRVTVAAMAELTERHPKLNVMNLEAVAFALVSGSSIALSPPAAKGVLPTVLDAEHVRWKQVTLAA